MKGISTSAKPPLTVISGDKTQQEALEPRCRVQDADSGTPSDDPLRESLIPAEAWGLHQIGVLVRTHRSLTKGDPSLSRHIRYGVQTLANPLREST